MTTDVGNPLHDDSSSQTVERRTVHPTVDASQVDYMLDPITLDDDNLKPAEESLQVNDDPKYEASQDVNPKKFVKEVWWMNHPSGSRLLTPTRHAP